MGTARTESRVSAKGQAEWCAAIKLGWLRDGWMKLFGILNRVCGQSVGTYGSYVYENVPRRLYRYLESGQCAFLSPRK